MKSAFLLGTTDYIGFKTTAVYRLHLVELVNGKKFAKKSNFSKNIQYYSSFKTQCANIISNKNVKLFSKAFTHEKKHTSDI